MRRGVWITLVVVVAVLVSSVLLTRAEAGIQKERYHQHRKQPSEEALGAPEKETEFHTHLPIIRIETGGQKIPGYPIRGANGSTIGFEVTEDGAAEITVRYETVDTEGIWHYADDVPTASGTALFRIRGNSSRFFSKSSYRLKLIVGETDLTPEKNPLLGMPPGEEWALYGPFLDKTLLRNYMWMNLSGEISQEWVPNVRYCELFLDGEYRGLYVLMEMIDVQPERVDLTKYRDGNPVMSYLVRIEPRVNEDKSFDNFAFYTHRMEPRSRMEILYPGLPRQTQYVKNYVETDFSEVERMIYAGDSEAWKKEVNLSGFVDYYIIEEFLGLNDNFFASTYFYRDSRGKLSIGPLWDFNNVLDNFFQPLPHDAFMLSQRGWYGKMLQDEKFVELVIARYRQLRKGTLSDEYLLNYIDETRDWLGSSIDRNFEVWGYSFDPDLLSKDERRSPEAGVEQSLEAINPSDYEEALEWMEKYMLERAAWMDQNIETLRQYCHPSRLSG